MFFMMLTHLEPRVHFVNECRSLPAASRKTADKNATKDKIWASK